MEKKKKRRVYKSVLGIPIWLITAISIFYIVSIIYDASMGDFNVIRMIWLGLAIFLLILSVSLHMISLKSVKRIVNGQFGK